MKYVRRRLKPHDELNIARMPHTLKITGQDAVKFLLLGRMLSDGVHRWCNENIGKCSEYWDWGIKNKTLIFYFYSKDAAVAFKLRWS